MVKINGEDKDIAGKNLLEYLNEAGYKSEWVVVERNLRSFKRKSRQCDDSG